MQVCEYTGRMPDTNKGNVVHFTGEDERDTRGAGVDRTFEQYLRDNGDGYDVALLSESGEYVFDTVTVAYSPNPDFYQKYRYVGPNEFPGE